MAKSKRPKMKRGGIRWVLLATDETGEYQFPMYDCDFVPAPTKQKRKKSK